MSQVTDMTGKSFGFLRVIQRAGSNRKGNAVWECECDTRLGGCGTTVVVAGRQLRDGITKSCGCLRFTKPILTNTTHGMRNSPEYRSWSAMKTRCTNSNCKSFQDYGGRGITVCEQWLESFANFYADMGPKPGPEYTLDRKNSDGNYEPSNCEWATRATQAKNRRWSKMFTINGRTECLAVWARERGVRIATARARLKRGLPIDQVLAQ